MGFFWGVDQDYMHMVGTKIKNLINIYFYARAFPPQKTLKSSSDGRDHHRNRSGVVELVGSEPLIIARVENGVTKFSPQRLKTENDAKIFQKKYWIRKTVFSAGNFHFLLAAGKLTLLGGGITSKLASQ